ncbi:non-ribosomal peptide synthetase [Mycobacterium intermedium]|uniref:Non-ribosomal peptide synthetase n=1 Tax=Mycobacterium intermedium TaxID=28445 RepID=A0A1E3SCF2_MYCIE|nr:non-ribosomal peptide synthetase [Mycobacterium intermedium]MCV6967398.1 non-ribosomal peptide synthetase [Mycobacterium intermedium]ODQ99247.1 non-ribosomal peptide synthetase [Mycobacterium intermedium]OPE49192.1 non-ribosomal peptide synthetase [Mycobacterium intermedium]ORB05931.1 non-ribosomal peptide synthetase [Mycobacterium intermedium]
MSDDAKTVQQRRRELLRRRIAESGLAAAPSVERRPIYAGERYGLSAGQRRMWFLQTMDGTDVTLNICVAYQLTGAVDPDRLRAAFNNVVARHAILRTTYGVDTEGEPYQVFSDDGEVSWRVEDVTARPEQERQRQVEAMARAEFGKPFDLTQELPLRVTLIRTGTDEFVLLLVVHHISWDDDSWAVFFNDLSAAYSGRPLAEAPQFIAIEVSGNATEPSIADVGYWADTLRPAPEPLQLPGLANAQPSRWATRRTRPLPAELHARVEEFARERSASPFMVLLAAFAVLVRRYTGAPDFVISVPVTDRRAAAEGAIGYFGNTLLLRMVAGPQDTFASFVDAVRETCLAGFAHQSVGIDRVVREANPDRTMGHDGMEELVRLGFSMRKSTTGLTLAGVEVRQLELGAVVAHLPLALAIVLEPDGAVVEFEYQTDVLSSALVEQMLVHYIQLLDHALAEPQHRLTSLDMLGPGDREAVLAQSHGELVPTPATTMVALLEKAATVNPDALAVVSDDAQLTYTELHGRANRLARWLIGQGVAADDVIGLRLATSIEFIVAVLGVLKAGAAYLPIDPAYPDDRIEYLVADARPKTVIGRAELDAAEQAAAQLSDTAVTDADRLRPLLPDHLAYVIYTSGSTGQPKGVAVPHHAIAEHVDGFIAEWSMTAEDRLLQSSSVSFDASLLDIFVTLALGARIIVPNPPDGTALGDIGYIADLISRHQVTVLHMVPSMLSTVLMLPQVSEWRALRYVPVGGEALPGDVADRFANYFDAELRNHYGPTEAVVCSTHMPVEGSHGARVVPIGVPNRNVYAYVLDEELQPVPAEVIGELYLGGNQLARGYLGRPGLTAQRFIADPFRPGERMYRTGDLVRRNIAGELEFVGRADEQVKVRGFRIELGEVEAVVARHPAVRHCLVVAEDTEVGPMLAAYLVPVTGDSGAELDLDEVRAHAAAVLPEYMVPSAFAVIPEIPLTVSGKLDKRALPAPTPIAVRRYREPATVTERRVCAIFARLFDLERVGADSSFFGLGGHSLLAARLVAQIRAEFGVELTVRAVFDTPTPAGLAARLVEQFRVEFDIELDELDAPDELEDFDSFADSALVTSSNRPGIAGAIRPERIPLSYSQLAAWFQYRLEGPRAEFNIAFARRIEGPLDADALGAALNDVTARHESLRTNYAEHEGVPYQIVHPTLKLELPIIDVSADDVDRKIAELRSYVLTPETGPLIRATLLRIAPHTHVLFIIVHHIMSDHASLGILLDDLVVAYRARIDGSAPQWAPLPFQFADYAVWQHNAFDSDWGQAELAYWRDTLTGLPDEIAVAHDHARPPVLAKKTGRVATFTVPAARRATLTQFAEQNGVTEFMLYQAVLAVWLHKLGGGTDIALGCPVACRVEPGATQLIGLFANMVLLRNDLSGDPTLRTVVERSRSLVLDGFAHQEVPYERVVEALNPPRTLSRNTLFQNMLHFHGEDWALVPRDLTTTGETVLVPLALDFDISLLDLDLSMKVTPDGVLEVRVVANADLYEPETVALVADALHNALDAFPKTPDLPVSRLELLPATDMERLLAPPTPRVAASERPQPATEGSTETQRILITLLEELLEITDVDPEDNFFALGGDSIISIKWSAQANARGLALTPPMVFEHMTIAELAAAVDAAADETSDAPTTPTGPAPEPDYQPMSTSGLDPDALAKLTASWLKES